MSSTRQCFDLPTLNEKCNTECGDAGGKFDTDYGQCLCGYSVDNCNVVCENTRPKYCTKRDAQGNLQVVTKTGSTVTQTDTITDELGLNPYDTNCHPTELLLYSGGGIDGYKPKTEDEAKVALSFDTPSSPTARRKRRAVSTQNNSTNNSSQGIKSPTYCLSFGSALMFKLTINEQNRTLSNYPRYRKNHLFNTNPNFDYGNFRQLHSIITETNKTLKLFVHVFNEEGTVVFYDNAVPSRETIVKVMKQGEKCPDGKNIFPTNTIALSKLGIKKTTVSEN